MSEIKQQQNDRRDIEAIKDRIDIAELIQQYIPLKQAGKNFQAQCPFHQDKTPSFTVSPDMQIFKCFGCGKSGDIFDFVMEYENLEFPDALKKLAKQAGVKLNSKNLKPKNKYLAILEMINHLGNKFYQKQLFDSSNKEALKYLQTRGFNEDLIKKFELGYAPGHDTLLKYINRKANFSEEQLLKSGLFKEKKGKIKDKFFKRVIFPIKNSRGKVIAFTGRILPGNEYGPKYMNTPETPLFHKSTHAYGIYESKNEIQKQDLAILCEGSTDVILAHQAGITNIVAPLGTSLTEDQLNLIKKYSENILMVFDNDSAGQKALERGFLLGSKQNLNMYASNTGKFKDLGELIENLFEKSNEIDQIKKGLQKKLIKERQDAFTYLLSRKLKTKSLDKYEDYKTILTYISILLQNVKSRDTLEFFVQKSEKLTGIKPDIIKTNVDNIANRGLKSKQKYSQRSQQSNTPTRQSNQNKNLSIEEHLLGLILLGNKFEVFKDFKMKYFQNEVIKQIIKKIKYGSSTTAKELVKEFDQESEAYKLLNKVLLNDKVNMAYKDNNNTTEEIKDIYLRLRKEFIEMRLRQVRQKLAIEEEKENADNDRIKELLEKIKELSSAQRGSVQ